MENKLSISRLLSSSIGIWKKRVRNLLKDPKCWKAANHCDVCWTTESGGRWVGVSNAMKKLHPKWSWACTGCYERPPSIGLNISYAEKMQRNLPPGHILGPEKNGMRGVFDVRNTRRR